MLNLQTTLKRGRTDPTLVVVVALTVPGELGWQMEVNTKCSFPGFCYLDP